VMFNSLPNSLGGFGTSAAGCYATQVCLHHILQRRCGDLTSYRL
jgi:hypothetical protein